MRIGVFDSGIGGITVLKKCIEKCPNHEYFYVGDTGNIPYGTKPKEELFSLSCHMIDFLLTLKVEMIIIACGTISSMIYKELTDRYSIPIINVLFPMVSYVQREGFRNVGLLATDNTVRTQLFETLLENKGIRTFSYANTSLVPLLEAGKMDTLECEREVSLAIKQFEYDPIEALILGCNHFSMVKDQVKRALKPDVKLLELGLPIAELLKSQQPSNYHLELYLSMLTHETERIVASLLSTPYTISSYENK